MNPPHTSSILTTRNTAPGKSSGDQVTDHRTAPAPTPLTHQSNLEAIQTAHSRPPPPSPKPAVVKLPFTPAGFVSICTLYRFH